MTVTETMDKKHQEDLQRLRGFRLLDDDFLTKCFEGKPECIELVLRIVLDKPDLEVVDVRTQVFVENLLNRSVRLDVLATDSTGQKFNIEIQRADKGAGRKRARYNSSMMDANLLEKARTSTNSRKPMWSLSPRMMCLEKGILSIRLNAVLSGPAKNSETVRIFCM